MKMKKLFRLLALFVVLVTSVNQVWARTFSGGEILYFTGGVFSNGYDAWNYDQTRIILRTSDESTSVLVSVTAVTGNSGFYQAIIPVGTWDKILVVRTAATSYSGTTWGGGSNDIWNRTNTLAVDGTANLLTDFKENADNKSWKWMIPKGATFYIDKTKIGTWGSNYYLRVGRNTTGNLHNKKYTFSGSLVTGTKNLYKCTTDDNYIDYSHFTVSNNTGNEGNGQSIFNIGTEGQSSFISHQLPHVGSTTLTGTSYTFIPTGETNKGDGNKVTYYTSNNYQGKYIFRITNNSASNGTVRLSYYDEENTKHYVDEGGSAYVLPTTIVTLEATPSSGYALTNVKLWDATGDNRDWLANGSNSNQYIVRSDVTFEGQFEAKTTKTIVVKDEHGWGSMSIHAWNLFTGTNTVDYPIKDYITVSDAGECNGTWYIVNISNEYYYMELYKTNDIGANAGDVQTKKMVDGNKYYNTNKPDYDLYGSSCVLPDVYYVETYDGTYTYRSNTVTNTADTMSFYANLQNGSSYIKLRKFNGASSGWTRYADLKSGLSSVFTPTSNEPGDIFTARVNDDLNGLDHIALYTGTAYIRTDVAESWDDYENAEDSIVVNAEYRAATNNQYTHYYMHWATSSENIKFDIANKFNAHLSGHDEGFAADELTNDAGTLAHDSNVRFMWNSHTGVLSRAYISGSSTASDRYLVLSCYNDWLKDATGNAFNISGLSLNEALFTDKGSWVYELDAKVKPGAQIKLTSDVIKADDSRVTQYFKGSAESYATLIGGNVEEYQTVRIVYDFKTNHLVAAWIPDGEPIPGNIEISSDIMLIRKHQEAAGQITFGSTTYTLSDVKQAYGVMQFNKYILNNKEEDGDHDPIAIAKNPSELGLYWISFPFNVRLDEVFGFGTYGTHWIIEYYDGKDRAATGYWADSEGFWKYVTPGMKGNYVLEANTGYVLALDLDYYGPSSGFWANGVENIYLYFPSSGDIGNITTTYKTVTIDQTGYECTIGPRFPGGDDRRVKDSYWHIIGVPSYADYSDENTLYDIPGEGKIAIDWSNDPDEMPFLYEWNASGNSYSVSATANFNFEAMHSYMVQYSKNTIYWTPVSNVQPASIAARVTETPNQEYKLSLTKDNIEEDRTYVRMTGDATITTGFEFNHDICKEYNNGRANIWTVTADTVPVAGNSLPHPLTTTIVPVGVKIAANGEYTFSMPEGTNGGDVWLIDNANSSRTNLGLMDYTVNLTTGTYEGRFSLEFPVQNVVTDIENAANANANAEARKVFVGGRLYILRDGKAYDATGAQVR